MENLKSVFLVLEKKSRKTMRDELLETLYQETVRKIMYEIEQAKLRGVKSVNVGTPHEKVADRIEKALSETRGLTYVRNKLSFEIDWSRLGNFEEEQEQQHNAEEGHLRNRIWNSPFEMMGDLIQGVAQCHREYENSRL